MIGMTLGSVGFLEVQETLAQGGDELIPSLPNGRRLLTIISL